MGLNTQVKKMTTKEIPEDCQWASSLNIGDIVFVEYQSHLLKGTYNLSKI